MKATPRPRPLTRGDRRTVHLVASLGGHLDVLRSIEPALTEYNRVWVTAPGRAARSLHDRGERVCLLPALDADHLNAANPRRSLGLALRERPRLVVTSGAGFAVAFCAAARAAGARLLFIETMARVTSSSKGGRVLAALAEQTFVQWPEMASVHRGSVVCRPALLEQVADGTPPPGSGTFVALGSHTSGFERCARIVEEALEERVLPRPARAQLGHTTGRSGGLEGTSWLPPDEMRAAIAAAEIVVCHGGAGIIGTVLRAGRRPLVVPRLARHGEHVDDHQLEIARKLAGLDLCVVVEERISAREVARARRALPGMSSADGIPSLADAVGEQLAALAGRPARL